MIKSNVPSQVWRNEDRKIKENNYKMLKKIPTPQKLDSQGKINEKEVLLINGTSMGHLGTNS